jgi:uncharacterized protein (DUF2141 family)
MSFEDNFSFEKTVVGCVPHFFLLSLIAILSNTHTYTNDLLLEVNNLKKKKEAIIIIFFIS